MASHAALAQSLSSYDVIAAEYYNPLRHPTCANFGDASNALIELFFDNTDVDKSVVLEVGCGRSHLPKMFAASIRSPHALILADASAAMLEHSRMSIDSIAPAEMKCLFLVADSSRLPLQNESIDLVISSLGDGYNTSEFWRECQRILRPGGRGIFTTPSKTWSRKFRGGREADARVADFVLRDGTIVCVPSLIYSEDLQRTLIRQAGLVVDRVHSVKKSEIPAPVSPKLRMLSSGSAVVSGYWFSKSRIA